MGEQHGHRSQLVLGQDVVDTVHRVLAGVDDDAVLTGRRRDNEAVGPPRTGWEPGDEHYSSFRRQSNLGKAAASRRTDGRSEATGSLHSDADRYSPGGPHVVSKRRQRELARQRHERRQQQLAERRAHQRRRNAIVAIVMVVLLLVGGGVYGIALAVGGGDKKSAAPATPTPTPSAIETPAAL